MSIIKEDELCKEIDTNPQKLRIKAYKDGEIKIYAFNIKTDIFEAIAEITKQEIVTHGESRWVSFAKARDGSKLVLFEE